MMFFSLIALAWFILEKGWEFFIKGEKSFEYFSLLSLTAIILIYGGYEATFGNENLWGSLIALLGATLRLWGRLKLKESFSIHVKKPEKIVTSGPYSVIRHPLYTGLVLICLGGVISSGSYLLALLLLLNILIILRKTNREEKILSEIEEFKRYKEKTWKLIPFIW